MTEPLTHTEKLGLRVDELTLALEERTAKIEKVKATRVKLVEKLRIAEAGNTNLQNRNAALSQAVAELEAERDRLQQDADESIQNQTIGAQQAKITELHGLIGTRNGEIKALKAEHEEAVASIRLELEEAHAADAERALAEHQEAQAVAAAAADKELARAKRAERKAVKAAREAEARATRMVGALQDVRELLATLTPLRGKIDGLLMKEGQDG